MASVYFSYIIHILSQQALKVSKLLLQLIVSKVLVFVFILIYYHNAFIHI